jgi:DNA-binding beta-propeller fold protein YncE
MIAFLIAAAATSVQPQTVLTIDPNHRLVEGVASDGKTIWVSSILDRQVLACRKTCRTLATLPEPLHPFAIAWDKSRKRLWVAADCPPGVPAIKACERGALIGLSTSGRVTTRISPIVGDFHPGDVSASGGEVFVSDSQNGMVFHLVSNAHAIMAVVLPDVGKSAQGTALAPDGKQVVVADYSQGIGVTGIDTFKRTLLPRQDGKPLRGIDGLVRCQATYYGIYNGASPGRLISFTIGSDQLTMDEPIPDLKLPDPTQIAYDGKRLLIVGNSGWASVDKPDVARTAGAPIIAIPLASDCKPKS